MEYTPLERWIVRLGSRSHPIYAPLIACIISVLFLWSGVARDSSILIAAGCSILVIAVWSYERAIWYSMVRRLDPSLAIQIERLERTGMDV